MHSASESPGIIDEYLGAEVEVGRILGTFQTIDLYTPVHVSHFGVIPKGHQENKWRLIVDLSALDRHSINNGIKPELCSLEYTKVNDAFKVIQWGPGCSWQNRCEECQWNCPSSPLRQAPLRYEVERGYLHRYNPAIGAPLGTKNIQRRC